MITLVLHNFEDAAAVNPPHLLPLQCLVHLCLPLIIFTPYSLCVFPHPIRLKKALLPERLLPGLVLLVHKFSVLAEVLIFDGILIFNCLDMHLSPGTPKIFLVLDVAKVVSRARLVFAYVIAPAHQKPSYHDDICD